MMILWQCLLLLLPLPDSNFSCFLHSFCWSASLQVINQSCAIRIYFKYSYLHKTFMVLHGSTQIITSGAIPSIGNFTPVLQQKAAY